MKYLQTDWVIVEDGIEKWNFNKIYTETREEFINELSDYESYWYETAEEFLEEEETTDWHDNALYYQWYLAGMQYAMSLVK